jgi:hypothetical protein
MDTRLRWTGWLGLAAAGVYVATTAAGSLLDPGYSQIRQHVSDLTADGAPTWAALVGPYIAYNLLIVAFAAGLYVTSQRGWLWRVGVAMLLLNALAGIGMVTWFREDLGGVPTTTAGTIHLVLAGISSLSIVVGAVAFGFAFRASTTWRPLARFSFAVAIGFGILGPLAAIATAAGSELAGLAERGPIGLFIVWLVAVGWFAPEGGWEQRSDGSSQPKAGRDSRSPSVLRGS